MQVRPVLGTDWRSAMYGSGPAVDWLSVCEGLHLCLEVGLRLLDKSCWLST